MNLAILGATGRVGQQLTSLALERGHAVTAVVRDASRLGQQHPHLNIIENDVVGPGVIDSALHSADVVFSALGDRNLHGKITLMSRAMEKIIAAMTAQGIRRVLAVAGSGILQHDAHSLRRDQENFPSFLQNVSEDHLRVWKMLEDSGLDWTLVCPPQIVIEPSDKKYRLLENYFPDPGPRIYSGDVADFLLNEMSDNHFIRKRVGIAN